MSEPMESENAAQEPPVLRPGSMIMMAITAEDYQFEYWPKLETAVYQLLTMPPAEYKLISYEQMYTCVYKCVCKQFGERLYNDLTNQITAHLEQLSVELQVQEPSLYIEKFHKALHQYLHAIQGIAPVFNYMNRFYVETKLRSQLNIELRNLFVLHVADKHISTLIPTLLDASLRPFSVSPSIMASLIKNLYLIKPEYADLRPHLFAKYIPNILPACSLSDLDRYVEEAQQIQRDLLTHPEFISGDQSRKRRGDDDAPKFSSSQSLNRTATDLSS